MTQTSPGIAATNYDEVEGSSASSRACRSSACHARDVRNARAGAYWSGDYAALTAGEQAPGDEGDGSGSDVRLGQRDVPRSFSAAAERAAMLRGLDDLLQRYRRDRATRTMSMRPITTSCSRGYGPRSPAAARGRFANGGPSEPARRGGRAAAGYQADGVQRDRPAAPRRATGPIGRRRGWRDEAQGVGGFMQRATPVAEARRPVRLKFAVGTVQL